MLINISATTYTQNIKFNKEKSNVEVKADILTFRSTINNTDYKLLISVPHGYDSNSVEKYPVLYLLDAQWDYTNVIGGFGNSNYDGFVPGIVIVGISYAGENPNYGALRKYDLTPAYWEELGRTGGANDFLKVLRTEIFPFIENNYNVDDLNRSLAGTSFGGLFALHSLFNTTDMFNGYIICNPDLQFDNELPFKFEKKYADLNSTLNADVFLVSGEYDNVKSFEKMVKQIESRNYEGLRIGNRILEGMAHSCSKSEAYIRGMHFLYERPVVELPLEELRQYTGTYEFTGGETVEITAKDGHLLIRNMWGLPDCAVYGLGNNKFTWLKTYNKFNFIRNKQGEVTKMVIGFNRDYVLSADKTE